MLVEQINRCVALSICVIIIKESRGSLCWSCYRLNSLNLTAGVRRDLGWAGIWHVWCASFRKWILCTHTSREKATAFELEKSSSLHFEFVLTTLGHWILTIYSCLERLEKRKQIEQFLRKNLKGSNLHNYSFPWIHLYFWKCIISRLFKKYIIVSYCAHFLCFAKVYQIFKICIMIRK